MAYNPNILREILRDRSISRRELSSRIGLSPTALEQELSRDEPRQGVINSIAKELAVPPFVFLMREAPELHDVIPDFRLADAKPVAKQRPTIETIQLAEGIQRAISNSSLSGAHNLPSFRAQQTKEIDDFALQAREYFEISIEDQISAADAKAFYILCRRKIENKGIFVIHESFPEGDGSGFCLAHRRHPVIVINTKKQTRGRRLFTLVHELAHVLMRSTGISDPFKTENVVERRCNRFAGSFLAPASYIGRLLGSSNIGMNPDLQDVAWASRRLKISQEATVVRLEQLGLYSSGSHENWKRAIHNLGNPDFSEKGGGGSTPPPQEKVKLAKFGFRFAQAFDELLSREQISEVNLYRTTGLKPRYQRPYFDYVKSLTSSELQSLELDDE